MKEKAIDLAIEKMEREYLAKRLAGETVRESIAKKAMSFMETEERIQWEMDWVGSWMQKEYGDL